MKDKLNVDEQIQHMKDKGIKFNIITETDAKDFLTNHTYYFKIKSYAKNYDKIKTNSGEEKYTNLEFAYMLELSRIDTHLRYLITHMCLDIEHFLKVKLLRDFNSSTQDGYAIVVNLFNKDSTLATKINNKANRAVCSDLINRYRNNFAIWNIVEVIAFGEFLRLYELFYGKSEEQFIKTLNSVRCLRNAAAHNNCLLNTLATPYKYRKNFPNVKDVAVFINQLKNKKVLGGRTIKTKLKNPVIHDFIAVLLVYKEIVPVGEMYNERMSELRELFMKRMKQNSSYFTSNSAINSSYEFIIKIIDNIFPNSLY